MPGNLSKPARIPSAHAVGRRCCLTLSGRRRGKGYRVFLNGKAAVLTECVYQTLIKLVLAHLRGGSRLAVIDCRTLYRLRQAIDKTLGRGVGLALIVTGNGEEYCLTIPAKEFKARVALTPCFFELIGLKLLSQEDADRLKSACRVISQAKADKLADDD